MATTKNGWQPKHQALPSYLHPSHGFFWHETWEKRAKAIDRLMELALKKEFEALNSEEEAHGCANEAFSGENRSSSIDERGCALTKNLCWIAHSRSPSSLSPNPPLFFDVSEQLDMINVTFIRTPHHEAPRFSYCFPDISHARQSCHEPGSPSSTDGDSFPPFCGVSTRNMVTSSVRGKEVPRHRCIAHGLEPGDRLDLGEIGKRPERQREARTAGAGWENP